MKEQNELFKEYKNLQQELGNKREQLSNLYRRKTELEQAKQQSVELTVIYQQIKNFNSEISKLEPTVLSLQKQHENLVIEANNITAINQNFIQQTIINQGKNQELSDLFSLIDSTLSELSNFTGQQIDTTTMVVKNIPKTELTNSKAMLEVCEKKSKEAFNEILSKLDNINASDKDDITLLMYSLKHGFWYGVDRLLDMGVDVNVTNKAGHNALMYACIMPRLKYILKIAEQTLDINQTSNEGNSALFYLCRSLGYIYSSEKAEELKEYDVSNTTIVLDSDLAVSVTEGKKGINLGGMSLSLSGEGGGGAMLSMSYASGDVYSVIMSSELIQLKGSALEYKTSKLIDYFIEREATINANCQQGLTPLYIACAAKNKYLVKYLISKGASLSVIDDNGYDGFMWLSEIKDFDGMEQLLDQGVDINRQDKNGQSILHYGVQLNNSDIIKFAVSKGINIDLGDANGNTGFYLACLSGNIQIAKLLKEQGANINILNKGGFHPIHGAVHNGRIDTIEQLIEWGVEVDKKSTNGYTPLQYYSQLKNAKLDVVKYLHSKGANLKLLQGDNENSLVHLAATGGNKDILELFINLGLDINTINKSGYYPIHSAVHCNNISTIETLLKHDPSIVNQLSKEKVSPLYYSLGYGGQEVNIETVKFLLNNNADATIAMYDGDTPMHMAHYVANKEALELLLESGANINVQNDAKKTPLHCMLEKQSISVNKKIEVLTLCQNKYDWSLKDNNGKTALDYAKEYCPETISYLSEHHQDTLILNIDLANDNLPLAGDHFDAHSHDHL